MIGINVGVAQPLAFYPFSGWKSSFYGDLHLQGSDGIDFYTRKKSRVVLAIGGEKRHENREIEIQTAELSRFALRRSALLSIVSFYPLRDFELVMRYF